jgi:hypothetical protein
MPTPNLALLVTPATNVYNVAPALTAQEASALASLAVVLLVAGILLIERRSVGALNRSIRRLFLAASGDKTFVTRRV